MPLLVSLEPLALTTFYSQTCNHLTRLQLLDRCPLVLHCVSLQWQAQQPVEEVGEGETSETPSTPRTRVMVRGECLSYRSLRASGCGRSCQAHLVQKSQADLEMFFWIFSASPILAGRARWGAGLRARGYLIVCPSLSRWGLGAYSTKKPDLGRTHTSGKPAEAGG